MKKTIGLCLFLFAFLCSGAQLSVRYDSSVQPMNAMQYFKPVGNNLFVGMKITEIQTNASF